MTADPAPDGADLLALAVEAATASGELLLSRQGELPALVATKTSDTDMVTELDRASESLVTRTILAARPHDAVLGEEGGLSGTASSGVRWVVDPLDGTTNYLYGFPVWGVSIAAEVDGEVVAGVVHDPTHGETFTAARGAGACCNGRPLAVVGAPSLGVALLATGFGYDAAVRAAQGAVLARVLPEVRDVRRAGAAAVDLCWVAMGRLDAYYERGLQPWDRAAGMLVAAEAGAAVRELDDGTVVAAAPHLEAPLLALLAAAGGHPGR
ncbi:MAG: inositol monophosphatase [Actinomycetota bacterium]|nr:inositol monophosphatase [Actinomycetota bacterium]